MPREDIIELIKLDMPDFTEGAFDVTSSSDDGGNHIQISVEVPGDAQAVLNHFSDKYNYTRIIVMKVPEGFLTWKKTKKRHS